MQNPDVLVLMEWYDHPIRVGIGRYAAERGWNLTVSDGCVTPRGWSGDGILTMISARADIIDYVRSQPVPCVDFGAFRPDIPLARVCGDHREIGRAAADHLAERGFARAAYFSTEHRHPHELRGAGFAERFAARTGQAARALVWALQPGSENDDWRGLSRWLRRELRALPKPLAVFCYCDYDAAKVESVCLALGYRIPDDVAVLGVDNDTLVCENQRVPLSSVRHDRVRVGYEGSALLGKLMRGGRAPAAPILIPPLGVELRASTDALSAADPLAREVLQFFRDNLGRSVGVADAARAVRQPVHRLEARVSEATGQTVYALLLRLRLFEARRLLAQTDTPVKEIARRTGFCHAQHLSNAFRRAEGVTPLAFRRRERRGVDAP